MSNEVFNMIGMSARRDKNVVNGLLWIYFIIRLYRQYGNNITCIIGYSIILAYTDKDMLAAIGFHMVCSDQIANTL